MFTEYVIIVIHRKMSIDIILGLQWGDEGKGKIVDLFSPKYKIVSRFQGGPMPDTQ